MNHHLILITENFPHGFSEFFLDYELPILSSEFETLTIIPLKHPNNQKDSNRIFEKNVTINDDLLNLLEESGKKTKSIKQHFLDLYSAVNMKYLNLIFKEYFVRPEMFFDPLSFLKAFYMLSKVKKIELFIDDYIKNNGLNIKNTLFYTYWLNEATLAITLLKNNNVDIKIISRAHRADLYERDVEPHSPKIHLFRNFVFSKINRVYPISEHGKLYLESKSMISQESILLSRLGVNGSNSLCKPSQDQVFRLVSCSFINKKKRIDLIIKGLELVGKKCTNIFIEWTHIGDGELKNELKTLASKTLPKNIKYNFIGTVPVGGVIEYYQNNPVDIFINVSETEGIPVSIMEAQSCGIPCIATSVGGNAEIVDDDNGYLMRKNPTADELSNLIESIIKTRNCLNRKRIASYNNWKLKFDSESNFLNFIHNIKSI